MKKFHLTLFKAKVAALNIGRVLLRPTYFALFIIATFVVSSFILWSLNLELVSYIVFEAPIALADKMRFFSETYRDIFVTYDNAQALGIVVFSLLFGINSAVFVYVLRLRSFKDMKKQSSASGAGFIAAVISGGCVACGTSLLAPLAATLGATSGAFLRDLSLWLNWIGSGLIIFSLYHLGQLAVPSKS